LGVLAVLFNVLSWLFLALPLSSAQAATSLNPAGVLSLESLTSGDLPVCGDVAPGGQDQGLAGHGLCPLCFPLNGHFAVVTPPLAPALGLAGSVLGLIRSPLPAPLRSASAIYRLQARAPPTLL